LPYISQVKFPLPDHLACVTPFGDEAKKTT
jgi:hypothetical protein